MLYTCVACSSAAERGAARTIKRRLDRKWRTIDIHCHCMVPEANALVMKATGVPSGGADVNANAHVNDLTRSIMRQRGEIDFPKLTDVETRLADMDRLRIDIQVVSPSPGHFVYAAPAEVARDSAMLVNDQLAALVASHPDRLMGMGTVPLQNCEMAVAELERTAKEHNFRGVEICTNVRGVDLTRAGLEKFFARVEELGVMIFMHPFGTSLVGRMSDHYFPNTIGHPLESALAVGQLIFDGYLEKFPKLNLHCARRRLPPRLLGPPRSRLEVSPGQPCQYQEAAVALPEETLLRHGGVLRTGAEASDRDLGREPHHAWHGLPVRHGRARSSPFPRPRQGRQHDGYGQGRGRQCGATAGHQAGAEGAEEEAGQTAPAIGLAMTHHWNGSFSHSTDSISRSIRRSVKCMRVSLCGGSSSKRIGTWMTAAQGSNGVSWRA